MQIHRRVAYGMIAALTCVGCTGEADASGPGGPATETSPAGSSSSTGPSVVAATSVPASTPPPPSASVPVAETLAPSESFWESYTGHEVRGATAVVYSASSWREPAVAMELPPPVMKDGCWTIKGKALLVFSGEAPEKLIPRMLGQSATRVRGWSIPRLDTMPDDLCPGLTKVTRIGHSGS